MFANWKIASSAPWHWATSALLKSTICRPQLRNSEGQLQPTATQEFSTRATDLEDIERATIERVFSQVKGDKALAGKMLGISRATLYRKLKRYNIGAQEDSSQSHYLAITQNGVTGVIARPSRGKLALPNSDVRIFSENETIISF